MKNNMYFVYILKSITNPEKIYIGYTSNIKERLKQHNDSLSFHTSLYKPWAVVTTVNFNDQPKAIAFEQYLKSGTGRAFVKKHFL